MGLMSEEPSAFWEDLAEDLKNDPGFARDYSRESTNIQAVDRGIMSMEDWKLVPQPESETVSGIALIHTLCGEGPVIYTPKFWTAEDVYQWIGFHLCDMMPVTPEKVIDMSRMVDPQRLAPHGGCNWEGCTECFPHKFDPQRVEVGYD